MPGGRLGVDGEHDGGDAALAIVSGDLGHRRHPMVGAEVGGSPLSEVQGQGWMAGRGHLGVHVNVDRDQCVEIHHVSGVCEWARCVGMVFECNLPVRSEDPCCFPPKSIRLI